MNNNNMEQATQRDLTKNRSGDEGVKFKKKTFHRKPVFWVTAILLGIVLAMVTILLVYVARGFASGPELPESMEGEATFTSDEGEREEFHFMIDYKKKLVQISSEDKMALPSFKGNSSANGMATMTTKIVVQDYSMGRIYFILPGNGHLSTKCTYTALQGDMIPRNLLKHATLKSEKSEGNASHIHLQVDDETEVDVYKAEGHNGKIYEVYLHLPNGTIHMHSKEKEANFTDYKQLNCYKYNEDNTRMEKTFYESNKSKLKLSNETTPFSNDSLSQNLREAAKRRRRGIGWRDGWLDWWYGNWCGYRQGGYQNKPKPSCKYFCKNSTSSISPACRNCLPPKDALDEACMEHDRCANDLGSGPLWCQPIGNACECDRPFVRRVYNLTQNCSTTSCRSHALQIHVAFKLLSCWYRKRTCFPVIRTKCRCWWCLCPRIRISTKCVVLKRCAFLGSGNV